MPRYRILDGTSAIHRHFNRTKQAQKAELKQDTPHAADLDNPYGRCYGRARSRDDLIQARRNSK